MPKGPIRYLLSRLLSSSRFKGRLWTRWYQHVEKVIEDRPIWFMNYGFVPADGARLDLRAEDEPNRVSIQLYDAVTRSTPLAGRTVLEISCGRGGGSRYLAAYRDPRLVIGLDRTERAVAFCRRQHGGDRLRFLCGDAQALPFADATFDAVVNVEASHCYPDVTRFLAEVGRVLRPGGRLLYADMRKRTVVEGWRRELSQAGFELLEEEEITANVLRALETTSDRVSALIQESESRMTRRFMSAFAATRGTAVYNQLKSGEIGYVRFVLRKP